MPKIIAIHKSGDSQNEVTTDQFSNYRFSERYLRNV